MSVVEKTGKISVGLGNGHGLPLIDMSFDEFLEAWQKSFDLIVVELDEAGYRNRVAVPKAAITSVSEILP